MSAIITATPVKIDSGSHASDFFRESLPYGKYATNGAAYQVLSTPYSQDPPAAFPTAIRIYKSTDNGATWVAKDTSNQPVTGGLGLWPFCSTFDGRFIYVVYTIQTGTGPFAGNLFLQIFDTSTDTWGAPGTASTGVGAHWSGLQTFVVKMSDRVRLFTGGEFIDNIAGTWDASSTVFNFGGGDAIGAIVDSLDRTHYIGPSGYQLIAANGTAGPATSSIGAGDGLRVDLLLFGPDSIAIAWTGASHAQNCKVAIGTPLSAPVFTTYTIETISPGQITYANLCMDAGAMVHLVSLESDLSADPAKNYAMSLSDPTPANTGLLTVRYVVSIGAPSPGTTMEIRQSKFDGISTWGAPVVYYDLLTNPPPGFSTLDEQFLENGQALFGATVTTPVIFRMGLQLGEFLGGNPVPPPGPPPVPGPRPRCIAEE